MEFDFSQNQVVEDLNKVPEQFRGAFIENPEKEAGGFVINPQVKPLAEAISGLNTALAKARKDAKVKGITPEQLLEPLGFSSIEEVQQSIATLKEQVEKAGDGKINLDKMKADMKRGFDEQLANKDKELNGMSASLQRYLVEKEAVNAITQAKGVSDLLLPHIRSQTKVVRDGEEFVVRVIDSDGEFRGDGKGGFMGIKDLVAELKSSPTFGRAFESEAPRGGGTPPRQGPTQFQQRQPKDMSPTEKIAAGLTKRG
jgi:hypothetical protein